jgi:hypothetical protein
MTPLGNRAFLDFLATMLVCLRSHLEDSKGAATKRKSDEKGARKGQREVCFATNVSPRDCRKGVRQADRPLPKLATVEQQISGKGGDPIAMLLKQIDGTTRGPPNPTVTS